MTVYKKYSTVKLYINQKIPIMKKMITVIKHSKYRPNVFYKTKQATSRGEYILVLTGIAGTLLR